MNDGGREGRGERGGGRVCRERWREERGEGDDREGLKHCYDNIQLLCRQGSQ